MGFSNCCVASIHLVSLSGKVEIPRFPAKQVLPVAERLFIPTEGTVSKLVKRHSLPVRHSGLDPESIFLKAMQSWVPDQVRHDGDVDFNQPILEPLVL